MKILILVLSAKRTPWAAMMDKSMATWDAENHPQIKTLYYCGKSDQPSSDKVFYSPNYSESLEHIAWRTVEAFEEALKLDWDVMARTHSSTYVHKRNLVEFIQTAENPTENFLCGLLTAGEKPFLWGGGSYIMSRDVIQKLVDNKDQWNYGVMEDNGLTEMANQLGIPFTPGRMASINIKPDGSYLVMVYGHGENFESNNWADLKKIEGHHYFRVKYDPDRNKDLEIMQHLWQNLA